MISVVIPARGGVEGLWYTISSCLSELESLSTEFEIIPVLNGPAPDEGWIEHRHSRVRYIFAGDSVSSPQAARQLGFSQCSGDVVFFLDAHVLVGPKFFATMLADMSQYDCDFLGAAMRFNSGLVYASHLDLDEYLWSTKTLTIDPPVWPFKVAVHPHGAFAVKREAMEKCHGYWLALEGFGGEETQLCLKFWLMGLKVWATPRAYHWHWLPPGGRHGAETFRSYDFVRNFLLVAVAYGELGQLERSRESMRRLYWGAREIYPELKFVDELEVVRAEREFVVMFGKYRHIGDLKKVFAEESVFI